jgi:hypothetical protein
MADPYHGGRGVLEGNRHGRGSIRCRDPGCSAIRRPAEPAFAFGPLDFVDRAFNYPLDPGLAPKERDRGDTEPENGS